MKSGSFIIAGLVLFGLGWIGYEVWSVVHHAVEVIRSVQS